MGQPDTVEIIKDLYKDNFNNFIADLSNNQFYSNTIITSIANIFYSKGKNGLT